MIKTPAEQTPQGYKVGDVVKTVQFKQIDGNLFPVIKGTITKIEHVNFEDGI